MKQLTIVVSCLALLSLACLQGAMISESLGATMAPTFATQTAAPKIGQTLTKVTAAPSAEERCVVVVAAEALHLRSGASEHAQILTWLFRGDVVRVVDQSDGDWWKVEYAGVAGFARSIYLQDKECE